MNPRAVAGSVSLKYSAFALLDHALVGHVSRSLAGEKIGARGLEVSRSCQRTIDHLLPLDFSAEQAPARIGHLLDLPIDSPERLGDVTVERPLLVTTA